MIMRDRTYGNTVFNSDWEGDFDDEDEAAGDLEERLDSALRRAEQNGMETDAEDNVDEK